MLKCSSVSLSLSTYIDICTYIYLSVSLSLCVQSTCCNGKYYANWFYKWHVMMALPGSVDNSAWQGRMEGNPWEKFAIVQILKQYKVHLTIRVLNWQKHFDATWLRPHLTSPTHMCVYMYLAPPSSYPINEIIDSVHGKSHGEICMWALGCIINQLISCSPASYSQFVEAD